MISNSPTTGLKYNLIVRFDDNRNITRTFQAYGSNVLELIDHGLRYLDNNMSGIKEINEFKVEPI